MELNNIKSSNLNWGDAANDLNQNFGKINNAIEQVKNVTTRNKGYFSSSDKLLEAYPSAHEGDIAYVNRSGYTPFERWRWNGAAWEGTGESGGNDNVSLGDYYNQAEIDGKFTNQDEKLSELGSKLYPYTETLVEVFIDSEPFDLSSCFFAVRNTASAQQVTLIDNRGDLANYWSQTKIESGIVKLTTINNSGVEAYVFVDFTKMSGEEYINIRNPKVFQKDFSPRIVSYINSQLMEAASELIEDNAKSIEQLHAIGKSYTDDLDVQSVLQEVYIDTDSLTKYTRPTIIVINKETVQQVVINGNYNSEPIANYWSQSKIDRGVLELTPYGDNGVKAYVYVDFTQHTGQMIVELKGNQKVLDVSFSPKIASYISKGNADTISEINTAIEQIKTDIEQIKKLSDPAILTSPIAYGGSAVNGATGTYSDGVLRITSSTAYGAGGFYMPSNKGKILVVSKIENTSSRDITITKNIGGNWKRYSDSTPAVDAGINAFLLTSVKVATIAPNGVKYYAEIFDTEASYEYTGIIFMFIGLLEGDTMNVSTKLYSFTDDYSLFNPADEDIAKSLYDNGTYVESNKSWEGKRMLAIGDSVTAMYYDSGLPKTGYGFYSWADKVGSLLNMKVRKHAEGGIGLIQMVDGHGTDAPSGVDPDTFNNKVYKLNTDDVKDVDVIILMGMYNEYGILAKDVGKVTDMYVDSTTGNTFMGRLNYAIKRIYEELSKANNLECKVLICGPHRHGKYPYSDEDAYQKGDLLNNSAKTVADYHSLHYIDLMHRGMINKYNWSIAQKSSVELNDNYISSTGINDGNNHPFASVNDAPSAANNKDKLITVVGKEYAYKSDGSTWVYGYITCPWNADQLHPSIKGSDMIGEVIAGELNTIFPL